MTRTHLLYGLLGVGSLCLILFVWLRGGNTPGEDKTIGNQHSGDTETAIVDAPSVHDAPTQAKHGHEYSNNGGFVGEEDYSPPPEIPADKEERIRALYDRMPRAAARPKAIQILTEGMDALSAAKYLETLEGHYGDYRSFVREYAARAVAENPGDFDALLFKTQRTVDDQEKEAGYRQLLEMNPDSVEVLIGLGSMLRSSKPDEAIVHLQKATVLSPEHPDALFHLAVSYEVTGQFTKALAAAEKAYENAPFWTTKAFIDSIKFSIEKRTKINPDVQPNGTDTSVEPVLEGSLPSESEAPAGEAPFDDSSITEPPADPDDTRRAEAQRAMEAEFEQLLADYERMIEDELDPSATVKGRIADLERSIESTPNRRESYLELAEAYEEAGEHEKAAEVYR